MIDINILRTDPESIKIALKNRQADPSIVDKLVELDLTYRKELANTENLRASQNALSKEFKGKPTPEQLKKATLIKEDLKKAQDSLVKTEAKLNEILETIPNLPASDVPVGKDDTDNVLFKEHGQKPQFDFPIKDHIEIGEDLDILDVKRAAKVSGSRFGYFKGKGAMLEMAIMNYAFMKLASKDFIGMVPPAMIKSESEWKCGYASNTNLFNAYYSSPEDDLVFISSSEHSVVPYHMDEILPQSAFPIKYVNYSPCFRRESGTYGKDTRGLFRVHFFNKVEMNVFTLPDTKISDQACLDMLAIQEEIMQDFGLHYQVVKACTGDLPQPNRRMYDINAWFPGQDTYRETHSCSNCTDYQARRLNTRVKLENKNEFVHILNATLVTDRALLAILENHQQSDGSVKIPECLWPFTGFKVIAKP